MDEPTNADNAKTPELTEMPATSEPSETNSESATGYMNWFKNAVVSQTSGIWDHIKRDIYEVANVVKNEPLIAAERTANSVYRQLSDVAHSFQQGVAPLSTEDSQATDDDIDLPIPDVKAAFTEFVSAVEKGINNLTLGSFSVGSETGAPDDANKRDAQISVIRADPKTFEIIPPTQEGILSYEDWRSAYFDEDLCSARPGIPISDGTSMSGIAPTHDSPSEVLEKSPIVRTHLLRLVDPDASSPDSRTVAKGLITEGDFWSRYYYRIWLFHGAEMRRHRLADLVTASGITDTVGVIERRPNSEGVENENIDFWPELEDKFLESRSELQPIASSSISQESSFESENSGSFIKDKENKKQKIEEEVAVQVPKESSPMIISPIHQDSAFVGLIPVTQSDQEAASLILSSTVSPSSSIVLVDDDVVDVDPLSQEGSHKSSSGVDGDGWGDDCGISLTEDDIKDADKELRLNLNEEVAPEEPSEAIDWDKWT